MFRAPRLLPTLLIAISLMFATKLGSIWKDAGEAFAQTPEKQDSAAKPDTPAPAATAAAAPAATDAPKPDDHAVVPAKPPEHYSPAEVQLLQELSKRRAEIEQRGDDLDRREVLLKAAEQRVDEKIAKLQQMQTAVDAALGKVEQQDDQHIVSLVHIYENMKPQDAARIFEGMEMPPLLQLISRMKDLKTAPILAAMAPEKARAVTIAMAQRKDIPDLKVN